EGDGNGIRRYDFPGSLRSRRADREGRPSCNHAWHFDFAARQLLPSPSRATCCRNNAGILSKFSEAYQLDPDLEAALWVWQTVRNLHFPSICADAGRSPMSTMVIPTKSSSCWTHEGLRAAEDVVPLGNRKR